MRSRVEEERRAREPLAPPTAVHPALREQPHLGPDEVIGFGIDTDNQRPDETMQNVEDPFRDPLPSPLPEHEQQQPQTRQAEAPGTYTPIETPMEDPVVETAQAVRYSQHAPLMATPPLTILQQGTHAFIIAIQHYRATREDCIATRVSARHVCSFGRAQNL